MISCLIIFLALVVPSTSWAVQAQYYVSPSGNDANSGTIGAPFRTIDRARDVVRDTKGTMSGDVVVNLRSGTHVRGTALQLNQSDSGNNGFNVIYQAYPGERPVISGGRQMTGWVLSDASKNIWRAPASGLATRQLYVNGVRAIRARSPSRLPGTVTQTTAGYTTTDTSMQSWGNKTDIEFVYNGLLGGTGGPTAPWKALWTEARIGVAGVTGTSSLTSITMKIRSGATAYSYGQDSPRSAALPTHYENAYELLDAPGEWYLNRSTAQLYYIPRSGENLANAYVIAPVVETLVACSGILGAPIHHVQFKGITFAYATFLRPNGNDGYPDNQSGYTWNYRMYGNVAVTYAHQLLFERCHFTHLGAAGLSLSYGCQNNTIIGCVFNDISSNGIMIGDINDPMRSDTRQQDSGNRITQSYIHDLPKEYHGGCGIMAAYTSDLEVSHNEIFNIAYSGVSIGWGWGRDNSFLKNNQIFSNNIHDFVQQLDDGAGIYGLSAQPGSSWNNNWIHNTAKRQHGGALYPDNGSAFIDISRNVISNMSGCYWLFMNNAPQKDNHAHDNFTDTSKMVNRFVSTNCTVTNTALVSGGAWPQAAVTIMSASGIKGAYADVKSMPDVSAGGNPIVAQSPGIVSQPASVRVSVGQTATFTVSVFGTAPQSIQWQKNNVPISGATGTSYTTPATTIADNGATFRALVSNSVGSVTSASASLTVTVTGVTQTLAPPTITAPANGATLSGTSATISWNSAAGAAWYIVRCEDLTGTTPPDARNSWSGSGRFLYIDKYTATSITLKVVSGHSYRFWIHSAKSNFSFADPTTWSIESQVQFSMTSGITTPPPGPNGLIGQYFDNSNFTGTSMTRTDATVNFNWALGSPASSMGVDYFSVRWTGQIQPQYSQTYTFYVTGDDGVRLWVNGVLIINKWVPQDATEWPGSIALTAGVKYNIKLEYFENYGYAVSQLRWSSASTPKAIIPVSRLYPAEALPTGTG
jgi:hypothetical protein